MKVLDVGVYLCKNCGKTASIKQKGIYVLAPLKCEHCGSIGPWKMLLEQSTFTEQKGCEV